MDSRWLKEDRKLPKEEQAKAIEESTKALKNSTLLIRRLSAILEDEVEKTYATEESYEGSGWAVKVQRMFARRQALKEVIKLLP